MKLKRYLAAIGIATLLASCSDKEDFLGDTDTGASDNFAVVTPFALSNVNPDFYSGDSVIVTATFNESVTSTVVFTGLESGAVRTLKHTGTSISGVSINWFGEHEDFNFFRTGEKVVVEYEVAGFVGDLGQDTVTINQAYHWRAGRNNALHKWSFEDHDVDGNPASWGPYGPDGGKPTIEMFETPNGLKAGHWYRDTAKTGYSNGASYGGNQGPANTYTFFNGLISEPLDRNPTGIEFTTDPDEVWFNVYIYGQGDPHVRATIVLGETDCPYGRGECSDFEDATPHISTDGYWDANQPSVDDRVIINQSLEHVGWKLFSYRYSSIAFATNEDYGGSGDKFREPHRINLVAVDIESDLPGEAEFYVDFPIITFGGPFDPTIAK